MAVSKMALESALRKIENVRYKNQPLLSNGLIQNGRIIATNLATSISVHFSGFSEMPACLFPIPKLLSAVRAMNAGDLDVELGENGKTITVRQGRSKSKIVCDSFSVEDFPFLDFGDKEKAVAFENPDQFIHSISIAKDFVQKNDTYGNVHENVFWCKDGLVAANGFLITRCKMEAPQCDFSVYIPRKACIDLVRLGRPTKYVVSSTESGSNLILYYPYADETYDVFSISLFDKDADYKLDRIQCYLADGNFENLIAIPTSLKEAISNIGNFQSVTERFFNGAVCFSNEYDGGILVKYRGADDDELEVFCESPNKLENPIHMRVGVVDSVIRHCNFFNAKKFSDKSPHSLFFASSGGDTCRFACMPAVVKEETAPIEENTEDVEEEHQKAEEAYTQSQNEETDDTPNVGNDVITQDQEDAVSDMEQEDE